MRNIALPLCDQPGGKAMRNMRSINKYIGR